MILTGEFGEHQKVPDAFQMFSINLSVSLSLIHSESWISSDLESIQKLSVFHTVSAILEEVRLFCVNSK